MVLLIKSNINTLRKNYSTRIKKLLKAKIKSQKQAAQFMVLHSKKHSIVISKVFKSFPYNLWVNETTPYKRVKLIPKFRPRGMKERIRFYYREVAATGVPQFFDIAAVMTRQQFPKIVLDNVQKALRATITR